VDRKPGNALKMARLEDEMGIRATYFFRTIPHTFKPEIIKEVSGMGHEIGYHYEDMDLSSRGQRSEVRDQKSEIEGQRSPRLNPLRGAPLGAIQLGKEVRDPQITPVRSSGPTPVPSAGATLVKYAALSLS